jgi:hypothetical protein
VGDLRLLGEEAGVVRFADAAGAEHAAVVEQAQGPVVPASCGAAPEPQRRLDARLA